MNHNEVLVLLRQAIAFDTTEADYIAQTISLVEQTPEFWSERSLKGHITTSAWIVTEDGAKALLLHSDKYDIWLQPGGHPEDSDDSLLAAAKREGIEETGLKALKAVSGQILDVDVHPIPEKKGLPAHQHYDVRFLFTVDSISAAQVVLDKESKGYQWVDTVELTHAPHSASTRRMALKTCVAFGLNIESNPTPMG